MEVAAGHAIAAAIGENELAADYIIPSVFNRDVVPAVASAVARAAEADGVARGSASRPKPAERYLSPRASRRRRRHAAGSCC